MASWINNIHHSNIIDISSEGSDISNKELIEMVLPAQEIPNTSSLYIITTNTHTFSASPVAQSTTLPHGHCSGLDWRTTSSGCYQHQSRQHFLGCRRQLHLHFGARKGYKLHKLKHFLCQSLLEVWWNFSSPTYTHTFLFSMHEPLSLWIGTKSMALSSGAFTKQLTHLVQAFHPELRVTPIFWRWAVVIRTFKGELNLEDGPNYAALCKFLNVSSAICTEILQLTGIHWPWSNRAAIHQHQEIWGHQGCVEPSWCHWQSIHGSMSGRKFTSETRPQGFQDAFLTQLWMMRNGNRHTNIRNDRKEKHSTWKTTPTTAWTATKTAKTGKIWGHSQSCEL